jgi:hypothetical protein
MKRREFLALAGGAAAGQPRAIIKIVDRRRAESSSHGLTSRTRMRG